ncbi:hypothetical protein CRUP_006101 [Coryphaenoides rupestris]|nr:hypothetical protein CRUP_006101 [Coryphaenoides rupestris]
MGNTESMESQLAVIRARAAPVKLPMPDPAELEERFSIALNSMNLPPDKVRLLRCYDNEKKWELICDQVKNPPHTYIQRLQSFLDPAVTRKKFRRRVQESTQTLRELEISLRTNHIGWVREFLNEENQGLDVLVEYLSFAQYANTFDGEQSEGSSEASSVDSPWSRSIEDLHGDSNLPSPSSGHNIPRASRHSISSTLVSRSNTLPSRRTLKNSRLVCKKDDVHVCVMCLRAIMNYQYGFNMVMSHPHAVNEIALSLNNRNPRTKALVLELLAAVCLVRGGHEIILSAFDNFKTVCSESMRFEKLMEHFKNEDDNIDFMVACMQFINIVVHSVEDMNFRVHLQLKNTESDRLQVQIQAYLDNVFDVGTLLEDAETKTAALERVEELEESMSTMTERLLDVENEAMMKIVELEKHANSQVHTLRRIVREKDLTIRRQSHLERTDSQPGSPGSDPRPDPGPKQGPQKGPSRVSLLDANRAKNLAITLRKAGQNSDVICRAIQTFDVRAVRVDFVECLMRFLPTEGEVKILRQYERDRKPLEALSEEDRFMMQFSRIERLNQRMTIITFTGNFTDNVQMLTPLLDTKSTDRKQTLLHYLAGLVKEKYSGVSLFYNELHYIDKAANDNVLSDVRELQRGMELTWREFSVHGHNAMLKDFISRHESRLHKLQEDARIAQDAFEDVVKFFGESSKTAPPSVFFPVFVRFIKAYRSPSHRGKRQQKDLISELRKKQGGKDSRHVYEGKDGAIEDIITVLKTVPFTARSAKRSSRFFCEPTHSNEDHY